MNVSGIVISKLFSLSSVTLFITICCETSSYFFNSSNPSYPFLKVAHHTTVQWRMSSYTCTMAHKSSYTCTMAHKSSYNCTMTKSSYICTTVSSYNCTTLYKSSYNCIMEHKSSYNCTSHIQLCLGAQVIIQVYIDAQVKACLLQIFIYRCVLQNRLPEWRILMLYHFDHLLFL